MAANKAFRKGDDRFINLGNGKTGGFKKGVPNGPPARTVRGKRRAGSK